MAVRREGERASVTGRALYLNQSPTHTKTTFRTRDSNVIEISTDMEVRTSEAVLTVVRTGGSIDARRTMKPLASRLKRDKSLFGRGISPTRDPPILPPPRSLPSSRAIGLTGN